MSCWSTSLCCEGGRGDKKKVRKSFLDFRTLLVYGNDRSRSYYFRFWISRAGLYSGSIARIF